jgi:hypothetical protein
VFCDPETTDAMRSVKVNTFFQPFKFEQLKAKLINSGTAKFIERSRPSAEAVLTINDEEMCNFIFFSQIITYEIILKQLFASGSVVIVK